MIRISAPLWLWSGGQGSWHFLTIPEDDASEIHAHRFGVARRGFGSVRVEATIKRVTWRTSVFPQKSGGFILPIKADVRRRAGIVDGDVVTVELDLL